MAASGGGQRGCETEFPLPKTVESVLDGRETDCRVLSNCVGIGSFCQLDTFLDSRFCLRKRDEVGSCTAGYSQVKRNWIVVPTVREYARYEGQGKNVGRKVHTRTQFRHTGWTSSHLTFRFLHVKQPCLDRLDGFGASLSPEAS